MVCISYIIVNIQMIYRTYQWQMTVLKGTPHHLGQSQFPLNHLARRKNILRPCEDCSGNRAGGIGIPTPIYLAIATLTNKLLLCTCSSEIKGKDCAKYDESQKLRPLQNPSNTKKTEHIHLSLALKSLHSSVTRPCNSFTPVKNLGKNCILFWESVQLKDNSSS